MGLCALLVKPPNYFLAVEIVEFTCDFAVDAARVELFLHPAALFAERVCAVTGGEFIGTCTLLVADVSSESVVIDLDRTVS